MQMIIVDAGSRYGLHPTLNSLLSLSTTYLFEPDKNEAERLKAKYSDVKTINIYDCGLGACESQLVLNIKEHPALSTTRDVNKELFDLSQRKQQQVSVAKELIAIRRLDSILTKCPDFFKLDIEGMELDALKGAGELIHGTTGIRCEVQLQAVHQGCSTFSEIDRWLDDKNFELISLDNLLAGRLTNQFSSNFEDGKLLSCDAIWINKNYKNPNISIRQLLISCIWLFCNGIGSESISLLNNYIDINGSKTFEENLSLHDEEKLMARMVQIMFLEHLLKSSLTNKNMHKETSGLYKSLFNDELPPQHLIRYKIESIKCD